MAVVLDVPAERYRKYENRTPLPTYLIERFALITGVTIEFLITGHAKRGTAEPAPSTVGRANSP